MTTEDEIRNWFLELQACVCAVDYDRAERIFAPDVVGFGTYEGVARGLQTLRTAQWQNSWPNIRDFTFRLNELHWGAERTLAWAICPWDSTDFRPDDSRFARPGRATVIMERRDERWLAVHTHFSLFPSR